MSSDVLLAPKKRHRASDVSKLRVRLAALFGFVLGFAMAFVTLLSYGDSVIDILSERPTTLMLATGEEGSSPNPIAAPGVDLYQEVRIVCMILTYSDNYDKAFHLNATWGKRCNRLLFISDTEDLELGAINVTAPGGYSNLWTKTREGFRYVYENLYDEGDWFLKADDDTYVVMENLRYMLYEYDTNSPIYFGHKLKYGNTTYYSGGAGYVLSKEALLRFMTDAYNNTEICGPPSEQPEDMEMGTCLSNVGVELGDSKDPTDGTQRFHTVTLRNYVQPNAASHLPDWMFNRTFDPILTTWMSGGAGYVLSKEALRRFMTDAFNNTEICCESCRESEDLHMGMCLEHVGVGRGNCTDPVDGKQMFYPLKLSDYLQSDRYYIADWIYDFSVDPVEHGPSSSSKYVISCHYMEPQDMYLYDALLYRIQVYGLQKNYRALPDKSSKK